MTTQTEYLYSDWMPVVRRDTYEQTAVRFDKDAAIHYYLGARLGESLPPITNGQWNELAEWITHNGIEL